MGPVQRVAANLVRPKGAAISGITRVPRGRLAGAHRRGRAVGLAFEGELHGRLFFGER